MATKAASANGDEQKKKQEPGALQEFGGNAMGSFNKFTHFLSDVRGEMRKVTTPTWKEVQVTTGVVIIAVFLFGLFFFVVDSVFQTAIMGPHGILSKLGGMQ